jgi:hypothetical protein
VQGFTKCKVPSHPHQKNNKKKNEEEEEEEEGKKEKRKTVIVWHLSSSRTPLWRHASLDWSSGSIYWNCLAFYFTGSHVQTS